MNNISTIILKITSKYLNEDSKYYGLICDILTLNQRGIHIEQLHDGILYIAKDYASFVQTHVAIDKTTRELCVDEDLDDLSGIASEFPSDGITIKFEAVSHPSTSLFPLLMLFYPSINPNIRVEIGKKDKLAVSFLTFDAFKATIALLFHGAPSNLCLPSPTLLSAEL